MESMKELNVQSLPEEVELPPRHRLTPRGKNRESFLSPDFTPVCASKDQLRRRNPRCEVKPFFWKQRTYLWQKDYETKERARASATITLAIPKKSHNRDG